MKRRIIACRIGMFFVRIYLLAFNLLVIGVGLSVLCTEPWVPSGLTPYATGILAAGVAMCLTCEVATRLCAWVADIPQSKM